VPAVTTPSPGIKLPLHVPNLSHLHLVGQGAHWTGTQILWIAAGVGVLLAVRKLFGKNA
jgi:hypothetical protein